MTSRDTTATGRRAWSIARTAYGVALRTLPDPAANSLRDAVARNRHRLPDLAGGGSGRIPVPGPADHAIVLIVATGCSPDRLAALVTHLQPCAIRTIWLVDTPQPASLADHVVEWLAPADTIAAAGFDAQSIRRARLEAIRQRYRPNTVVIVGPVGPLPDRALVGPMIPAQPP